MARSVAPFIEHCEASRVLQDVYSLQRSDLTRRHCRCSLSAHGRISRRRTPRRPRARRARFLRHHPVVRLLLLDSGINEVLERCSKMLHRYSVLSCLRMFRKILHYRLVEQLRQPDRISLSENFFIMHRCTAWHHLATSRDNLLCLPYPVLIERLRLLMDEVLALLAPSLTGSLSAAAVVRNLMRTFFVRIARGLWRPLRFTRGSALNTGPDFVLHRTSLQ